MFRSMFLPHFFFKGIRKQGVGWWKNASARVTRQAVLGESSNPLRGAYYLIFPPQRIEIAERIFTCFVTRLDMIKTFCQGQMVRSIPLTLGNIF